MAYGSILPTVTFTKMQKPQDFEEVNSQYQNMGGRFQSTQLPVSMSIPAYVGTGK